MYHHYRQRSEHGMCVYLCVCLPLQVLLLSLLHHSQQNDHTSLCLSIHAFPCFNIPGQGYFHTSHLDFFFFKSPVISCSQVFVCANSKSIESERDRAGFQSSKSFVMSIPEGQNNFSYFSYFLNFFFHFCQ